MPPQRQLPLKRSGHIWNEQNTGARKSVLPVEDVLVAASAAGASMVTSNRTTAKIKMNRFIFLPP